MKNEYTKSVDISFNLKSIATMAVKNLSKDIVYAFKDSTVGKTLAESFSSSLESNGLLKNIITKSLDEFSNIVRSSMNELDRMLDFSRLSKSETRKLAYGYGFSKSQAYGYDTAMKMLDFESEEDLFNATNEEMRLFRESFEKYSNYYTELYDSGFFNTLREYKFEMEDFKREMQMEVITFFMDNKDVIKKGMIALMKISEGIAKIFAKLVDWFGNRTQPSSVSDVVNQYRTTSNSTRVNISNQFTNTPKEDETWLANAGELTYEQVVRALGGDA